MTLASATSAAVGSAQLAPASHDPRHPDAAFESWTLLTELTTEDGGHHGVAAVFFTGTVLGLRASGIYVVLTEDGATGSLTYQQTSLPLVHRTRHDTDRLLEEYRGNRLERALGDGAYEVRVRIDDLEMSLDLRPTGPALTLGPQPVGQNKVEEVVIVPRGAAAARIVRGRDTLTAFGSGLMQHAWGDPPELEAAGTVLAIVLDDGTTVSVLHGESTDSHSLAVAQPNGTPVVTSEFDLRAGSTVAAGPAGNRFGVEWRITSDAADVDLTIEFAGEGQEVALASIPYWFARCSVAGVVGDQRVEGVGHVYVRASSGTSGPSR